MPQPTRTFHPTFTWGIPVEDTSHADGSLRCALNFKSDALTGKALPGTRQLTQLAQHDATESLPNHQGITVLLPGFVNAHTHLELYTLDPLHLNPDDDMIDWLLRVIENRHDVAPTPPAVSIHASLQELQACGTTTVADITQHPTVVFAYLKQAGMVGNVAVEGFHPGAWPKSGGLFRHRGLLQKWRQATLACDAGLHPGVSPHSPYNVSLSAWKALGALKPPFIHMHLGEFMGESHYLEQRKGQQRIQHLHQQVLGQTFIPEGTWVEYLNAWPANTAGLLAHASCVPETVLAEFLDQHPGVFIASCPRSNLHLHQRTLPTSIVKRFSHRIVLGTDSRFSTPSLDVREEWAVFVHHHGLTVPPLEALEWLTLRGYQALGISTPHMPWVLWELTDLGHQALSLAEAVAQVLAGKATVRYTLSA
jgi:aminodeoxyfutalosine deaminase